MAREVRDNLYIGDLADAEDSDDYDKIMCVAEGWNDENTDLYYPMLDGSHDYEQFEAAVSSVRMLYDNEMDVLVYCQMGQSRSVCVVTAAIAAEEGLDPEDVLYDSTRLGHTTPSPKLWASCLRYVDENT